MCFSLIWFRDLFVFIVIVCAIYAMMKLLVPYLLSKLGTEIGEGARVIVGLFKIFLWALIFIFVIYIAYSLIVCLLSYSGGFPTLLPKGR